MKRRYLLTTLLLATTALAGAQQSPLDNASSWLQTQWQRVQNEGRPAAERIVRQFPERFKTIKVQVARVSQLAAQFSDVHHLDEKKALLLELWRVRGSLNLLALLSPNVLHQLTGLDTTTLTNLQAQLTTAARKSLARLPANPLRPATVRPLPTPNRWGGTPVQPRQKSFG